MSIVCLLAGIVASRPSAFVAVTGLEPVLMVAFAAGCTIYQLSHAFGPMRVPTRTLTSLR